MTDPPPHGTAPRDPAPHGTTPGDPAPPRTTPGDPAPPRTTPGDPPAPRLRTVLYVVDDVSAAVAFYRDALGLPVRFRDGDRYAAVDAGGVTLGLAGPDEDVTGGSVAASFKVSDVPAAVRALIAAGAALVRGPETGPHEVRAVLRDPAGNPLVLYSEENP